MELLTNIQKKMIRGKKTIKDKQGDILLEMDRERERVTTIVITMIAIVILIYSYLGLSITALQDHEKSGR